MRLKGFGHYSTLNYQFVERDGKQGLLIRTEESELGQPIVRPLILIDGSSLKNVTFNLGARVTWLDIGGFRSEWRNDIIMFSQYGLRSEYYHPFTPLTRWFIAPRGLVENDPFYLYNQNKLVTQYRRTDLGGDEEWNGLDVSGEEVPGDRDRGLDDPSRVVGIIDTHCVVATIDGGHGRVVDVSVGESALEHHAGLLWFPDPGERGGRLTIGS